MMGEGDRASRPSSLLLDGATPEREPLKFDVQLVGAPPEVEQLVNNIKQVAEEFLYHWKTFPIVLPPSRFSGPGARLSDIIIAPPCDELDAAALDAGLEPHPLSPKQLHSIREKGEFEVPSRHFPGQVQRWRMAGWLQRGRARLREDMYCHVARAAALIVVVARDRLLRDEPLSVVAGAKSFLGGLHRLLDLLVGMPSLEARDLEKRLREERSRYLVAELICKAEYQDDISALAAWVTRAMRRAASEKSDAREVTRHAPPVPCVYTTPQRTQVDLRLHRRELLRRCAHCLQGILERESRGWFLHFRERRAAQLTTLKMPLSDIEEEVRAESMQEYVSRVASAVTSHAELRALGAGVPELLASQLRAYTILQRAEENVRKKVAAGVASAEARIRAAHPILSRADSWRNEKVSACSARLGAESRWAALDEAAAGMLAHQLAQHRYFLLRDRAFLRDREPLLCKELQAAKSPTRQFTWATRLWRPASWRVTRHFRGHAQRIPTVLSGRLTSIVTPRSDPSQPVYLVDKEVVRRTETRWPGWRILNWAHRSWCWSWNMMFLLGVVVPWCSPVSARSLLAARPFVPDYELSQVNGTLFPKRSSETHTMWSRLLALWRHVSKERTRFETEPDTGLLGKGLSRQANRLWNYAVVGGAGSVCLLLLFPLAVACACAGSLLAAAAAPLYVPPLALALHALHALLYDRDAPHDNLNRWFALGEVLVWRLTVLGVLQCVGAVLAALVVCPLCALLILIGGVSWCAARGVWESAAWRALISVHARVPHHDSAFCRRVPAAGTPSTLYYQITAAQAVSGVAARAELETLNAWASALERTIDKPLRDYEHFVHACFGPFSVQIAKSGAYKQLEKECVELTASLREKVSARRRDLALALSDAARARCRMTRPDLRCAIETSARLLSCSGVSGVSGGVAAGGRGEGDADEWWSARGLAPGDWLALAANMMVEVFDGEILVALEEREPRVEVGGGGAEGARGWSELCARREPAPPPPPALPPPPDVLAERADWMHVHGACPEWGGCVLPRVPAPSLELAAFSPRAPPLPPVPAPAHVALVLYNRDADTPVPLDSDLCADVLRTLEDAPDCDDTRDVERCRGGGGAGGGAASEAGSVDTSDGTLDDDEEEESRAASEEHPPAPRPPAPAPHHDDTHTRERATCRWTLTGRGVRLRADLASPEDVTLDADRGHVVGTCV